MNDHQPLVSARDVRKSFVTAGNRVDVLQGVDLDIYPGEMIAIVGASGVGKSTLLHVLGTLERPDRGEILYLGESVSSYDEQRLASFRNQTIGFVFQFHHLLPEFDALENTMMPALIGGMKAEEASARAEVILTRVGLEDRFKHRVGELSGGEQQRVAVARSLMLKPSILLADEPTGNLDARTGESIHNLLISLNRDDGVTAAVVTHNMTLAEKLSRKVTLVDGKVLPID